MILLQAPVLSESGYGHKAREIAYALIKNFKDDVKIIATNWGTNINTGLDNSNYRDIISKHIVRDINVQPQLHVVVGVPEDIRALYGQKNILFTSGVEVDIISSQWITKLNSFQNLDLIVVPSKFVKDVFDNTKYTDDKQNVIKLNKKVVVIPESYDERMFDEKRKA